MILYFLFPISLIIIFAVWRGLLPTEVNFLKQSECYIDEVNACVPVTSLQVVVKCNKPAERKNGNK
jgi:hypothetical protein